MINGKEYRNFIFDLYGTLTDIWTDEKRLSFWKEVYEGANVSAAAVAAHECGHALQHDQEYAPLKLRSALVPVVPSGSVSIVNLAAFSPLSVILHLPLVGE